MSIAHLLKPPLCAIAIAEHIDGRLEVQVLAAGVLDATEDGVSCGVGRGPILARAGGLGGSIPDLGSMKRGRAVVGVGVLSWEVDMRSTTFSADLVGVGVVGDGRP